MHPVFILAFVTFLLLAGFLVWNIISTKRHRFGRDVTGPGGSNDPLSGKTEGMRNPDEMRAAWDKAGQAHPGPSGPGHPTLKANLD